MTTTTTEPARAVVTEHAAKRSENVSAAPVPVGLALFLGLMGFFFALVAVCFYMGRQIP